jgi:hypothetical protein
MLEFGDIPQETDMTHSMLIPGTEKTQGGTGPDTSAGEPLFTGALRKPEARIIASERRNSPLALAILLIACAGILFIAFAPKGSFISQPSAVQSSR